MKTSELRQMTDKKLHGELKKAKRDKAVAKFHAKTGQNQDTAKIGKLKKLIAQIKTLLQERKNQPAKETTKK